ncbi:EAL domain-containing protein [Noviherbaspirillum sp. 1P10PC]|uniref:sensor domain-containing phosphodiesterase n=1 Tax=Noviherbaspirillum sp. 1P10PC TaxID=3132292 RepID=UPI0039A36FED
MDIQQHERRRLEFLLSLDVLDTDPEEAFDRIAESAASLCNTPIAAITLLDERRQWFKSSVGLALKQTERSSAFCNHTIRGTQPFIVTNAADDPLFADNPLVTGSPGLRFYAGCPLISSNGYALGALAVMDTVPRTLDDIRIRMLRMLADQIMVLLELRQRNRELERTAAELRWMNQEVRQFADHLKQAQRIAGIGSWEVRLGTGRLHGTEEFYAILGLRAQADGIASTKALMARVPEPDRRRLLRRLHALVRDEKPMQLEHRIITEHGDTTYVMQRAELRHEKSGATIAGTMQDITQHRLSQEKLTLFHTCMSRVNEVVMITDASPLEEPGPRVVFVNDAFERLTGYTAHDILGRSPRLLQGPETSRAELDRIRAALRQGEPVYSEVINYGKHGQQYWLALTITPITDDSGRVSHFVSIQRDITRSKIAEQQIEQLAFYDPLTRLPNRRLLLDRLRLALNAVRRSGRIGALLFIDLDNFKSLNDTLGHDKGDRLLEAVARRLEGCVRKSNTVARLGGDEFVIMIEDIAGDAVTAGAHAELVVRKILAGFTRRFELNGIEYHCTPSVGVALFDRHIVDVDDLLKQADLAMYHAKAMGRNTACFFDPDMQSAINARVALERELRAALHQHQFELHYQPQVEGTGRIVGYEALIRWRHPRQGLVFPQAFIPLAEETGLIRGIGRWVLQIACRQLASWSARPDHAHLTMSVNVSAGQFGHPEFMQQVLAAIASSGADPRLLKLELTESVLVKNSDDTIAKMEGLREHGIRFALDDFGTGYSSLSYLKRLPLHQIKIDQSFVRDVLVDPNDAAIVRTILALGRILGLDVIAEGVEVEAQRDFLARHGCHGYQGYLFGQAHQVA